MRPNMVVASRYWKNSMLISNVYMGRFVFSEWQRSVFILSFYDRNSYQPRFYWVIFASKVEMKLMYHFYARLIHIMLSPFYIERVQINNHDDGLYFVCPARQGKGNNLPCFVCTFIEEAILGLFARNASFIYIYVHQNNALVTPTQHMLAKIIFSEVVR